MDFKNYRLSTSLTLNVFGDLRRCLPTALPTKGNYHTNFNFRSNAGPANRGRYVNNNNITI